jgi:hypothetical protein
MSRELSGWVRPRSLRIAFLVQDGEHSAITLDAVFADCYNRWGGRFSILVPCRQKCIPSNYWPWLEAYDPDIVYSYVALSRIHILEVYDRLNPSAYIQHELRTPDRLDAFSFRPSYGFAPLSSLSTIFRLGRHNPASSGRHPIRIIDSWHTENPSRLLTDNFGTYHTSNGGGVFPPDATPAAGLRTIVSPKFIEGRYGVPRDLDMVPSEAAALAEFTEGRATSLSILSALFAPKLELKFSRWSQSFALVIGDTFEDRVLFWNARLHIPAWLDHNLCALRVGREQMNDASFLDQIGNLLKRHNRVNAGSGGQSQLELLSTSLDTAALSEVYTLLQSTKPWYFVVNGGPISTDQIVPSETNLRDARETSRFGGHIISSDWIEFQWTASAARPPPSTPDHLAEAPPSQHFTRGYWANELFFEFDGPGPRFGSNRWYLPRRWRLAGAFESTFSGGHHLDIPPRSRRGRDGCLTLFVARDRQLERIEVPTPFGAIAYALAQDGSHAKAEAEGTNVYPLNKVVHLSLSNEARYFTGVVGMAGGLDRASRFLLHPFLKDAFSNLGGTPNPPFDKMPPTVNRLTKRARRSKLFNLANEDDKHALAHLILKASREIKRHPNTVAYEVLRERWKAHRSAYWKRRPKDEVRDSDDAEWDQVEERTLDECLADLRQRQMIFQGHLWTCSQCHHRNWVDLSALVPLLSCEICKHTRRAPVNVQWLFRPNEFLIESLRDRSTLSLLWALNALRYKAQHSFMFLEPIVFRFDYDSEGPDAEADLLVLLDGKALLCEVKSSWQGLQLADINDLVELGRILRPDTIVIAVMDHGSGPQSQLRDARANLAVAGIDLQVLTLENHGFKDEPYLPYEDE